MADEARLEQARLAKVIDHPARQRIIELLGTRGALSWKELSSELGIGTGALYYHLDTLEGIVARDSKRKYVLTRPGGDVFSYLQHNGLPGPSQPIPLTLNPRGRASRAFASVFWPRSVVYGLTSTRARALAGLVIMSGLFLSVELYYGHSLTLLLLWPASGLLPIALGYFGSLAALTCMGYVAARVFFAGRASVLSLATSCAFSLVPVTVFMVLTSAVPSLAPTTSNRSLFTVLLVFFQTWSAGILGAGVSVSGGVRMEKAVLVSLFILYATAMLLFLQGSIV
jgi:hypothetical protein